MDDTPTTPRRRRTGLWIVLAVIAALLFACIAATVAGAVGYAVGRSATRSAVSVPEVRVERVPLPEAVPAPELPEMPGMASGWALVVEVTEDSPADRAGLRVGDFITAVEDESLSDEVTLSDLIQQYEPGDEIELTVLRDGRDRTVTVTLGRHPAGGDTPWMGITYRTMPGVPNMRYEAPPVRDHLLPFSRGRQ